MILSVKVIIVCVATVVYALTVRLASRLEDIEERRSPAYRQRTFKSKYAAWAMSTVCALLIAMSSLCDPAYTDAVIVWLLGIE